MLCKDGINQAKGKKLSRQGAGADVSIVVYTDDHVVTSRQRGANSVQEMGVEKGTGVRF